MSFWLVKPRTSWPEKKLAVIETVAPVRFVLSTSDTVIAVSVAVAAWFSV